jgi:hypothetical protein
MRLNRVYDGKTNKINKNKRDERQFYSVKFYTRAKVDVTPITVTPRRPTR